MGWGLGLVRIRQQEMGRAGCRHLWSANKGHGRQTWQLAVGSLVWLRGKLNPPPDVCSTVFRKLSGADSGGKWGIQGEKTPKGRLGPWVGVVTAAACAEWVAKG